MSLKKDVLEKKNNVVKNIKDRIVFLKSKFMPKGMFKSTIADYRNGDQSLINTIGNLIFSAPVILLIMLTMFSIISIANGDLNTSINLFIMFYGIYSFFFGKLIIEKKDKTIAERKLEICDIEIKEVEERVNEINKIIDKIFNENKNIDLNGESFIIDNNENELFIFDKLINIDILNEVENSLSKKQIIDLLKMTNSENIKYSDLIKFILELESEDKANKLYQKMFSNKKENVEKTIKEEILA